MNLATLPPAPSAASGVARRAHAPVNCASSGTHCPSVESHRVPFGARPGGRLYGPGGAAAGGLLVRGGGSGEVMYSAR